MLTPAFSLEQDNNHLHVRIKAPLTKISESEVFIDGYEFKFYSKPYYLRLNLPGKIRSDSEKAKYVADEGTFVITVEKEHPGEEFDGLDMLTKLLAPAGAVAVSAPLIEVIDSTDANEPELDADSEEEEEFDWQVEQEVFTEEVISLEAPTYGFAGKRSGVLGRLQAELLGVVDLEEADKTPSGERKKLRLKHESEHFSDDHYLADLYEDDAIRPLLKYRAPWVKDLKSLEAGGKWEVKLSGEEQEKMMKLPRKEYLLSKKEEKSAMLNLVDIIFAYAYDQRINEGDTNVESPWTICKLSGTLSWLQTYNNLDDVVTTCFRRCLSYPLYRHCKLARKVLKDTIAIFKLGRRRLLKSLLHIHGILQSGDNTYVLNDLYVTDYCVWIQHVREKRIKSMASALERVEIKKGNLELDLIELERAATLVLQEEEDHQTEETVNDRLSQMNLDSHPKSCAASGDSRVSEAVDAMQGLHIQNPHALDQLPANSSAKRCHCFSNTDANAAACHCKYYIKSKGAGKFEEQNVSRGREESGTEDSSISSDTPSDSSDSSEDSSTDSSDTEHSEAEERRLTEKPGGKVDQDSQKEAITLEQDSQKEAITVEQDSQKEAITPDQDSHKEAITPDQDSHKEAITPDQDSHKEAITPDQDSQKEAISLDQDSQKEAITLDQDSQKEAITLDQDSHKEAIIPEQDS